ncbi:MAG: MBL fold metallo-hydrolase [Verrucomicrobiota bacterium]
MKIHTIDLQFRGKPQSIASFLVDSGGELALIETGPTSTIDRLTAGIGDLGFDPDDVGKVLVTHIHLDHAGAAGWWGAKGAQVFVHHRGARHLVDPSKLIEGARMVYGDQLESLWGEVKPIPDAQVTALGDGDKIEVGETEFSAWDTPGHARHHHVFVAEGVGFAGDIAGVRLPGQTYISPTTAPSQFEPEPYLKSMRRVADADLERLYLTHFGEITDISDHFARYEEIILEVADLIQAKRKSGATRDEMIDAFVAFNTERAVKEGVDAATLQEYENANPSDMCVDGIDLYWRRQEK